MVRDGASSLLGYTQSLHWSRDFVYPGATVEMLYAAFDGQRSSDPFVMARWVGDVLVTYSGGGVRLSLEVPAMSGGRSGLADTALGCPIGLQRRDRELCAEPEAPLAWLDPSRRRTPGGFGATTRKQFLPFSSNSRASSPESAL